MRIAVYGTGGVGGYFGGLLTQAGHEVAFLARGPHLAAIRENGLQVCSVNGDFHIFPAQATDDPREVGPVDLVIVAVKHFHLAEVAGHISPLVGRETMVVPLLNGVDAHEPLIASVGKEPVVGGLCSVVAYLESPGVIRQESKLRRVVVGELDRMKSDRVEQLVQAWANAGAEAVHAGDIHAALWTKFLFIASFGGVGALVGLPAGAWRDVPETRALFVAALREIDAVGRAAGVNLAPNAVDTALTMTDAFEPGTTSSMQRDAAAGKAFELEAFSGTVIRLGKKWGVSTPVHEILYALLLPKLQDVLLLTNL